MRHRRVAHPVSAGHPAAHSRRALQPTIVEYLKFARKFNAQFPGLDTDIHGLVEEPDAKALCATTWTACGGVGARKSSWA
jgi:hypothetical protein